MIGYITLFVPAGIGIREAVIVSLEGQQTEIAALFSRMITTWIDLIYCIPRGDHLLKKTESLVFLDTIKRLLCSQQ